MGHFAITAIGTDRPGIVAGLTEALREVGCNLEDVSSTILRGHFAMMFVVDAPESDAPGIQDALHRAAEPLGVTVTVRDVEAGAPDRPEATHTLTVYGADKPGIVAGVAGLLAERSVNITNLSCRIVGEEAPVYAMVAEVEVPADGDARALAADIDEHARRLDVDASLRPIEIETL